ncbi:hypothetical protein PTSG_06310 [Salpingoeca rosetta]|uniref:Translocation protein SEC62 n=1 Tax=Salpingoeca rosetta (strain ATCC 50818 / BSB-021) TaxID=946362 RepID=F2UCJ4_SALR5|nr:uncharacterized protein PTSG_06310 [Salpingoeca rosetta]EGD74301.1 hypothetical protein PTSG_06310 [Salpingoeca rosetta]|eukprot:XP_004993201.1 hypothetical protein PTSG_06310 [Salpingoeca rosetta]
MGEASAQEQQQRTLKDLKRAARKLRLNMPTKEKKVMDRPAQYFSGGRLVDFILKELGDEVSDRDQAVALATQLLRSRFFYRAEFAERRVKSKDGEIKTKKKLQPVQDQRLQLEFLDDPKTPYVWLFTAYSMKQYLLSLVVLVVVGLLTTIPVWPQAIRGVVHGIAWYTSMTLLILLLTLFLVRYVAHLAVYYGSGRTHDFWILPNINDETIGVLESFKPLYSYGPVTDDDEEDADDDNKGDGAGDGDEKTKKNNNSSSAEGEGEPKPAPAKKED